MKIHDALRDAIEEYLAHIYEDYSLAGNWYGTSDATKKKMCDGFRLTTRRGRKFIKIIQIDADGSKRVHSFVDVAGTIWKAAGWNAPAKNFPRGNVHDAKSYRNVRWTGI